MKSDYEIPEAVRAELGLRPEEHLYLWNEPQNIVRAGIQNKLFGLHFFLTGHEIVDAGGLWPALRAVFPRYLERLRRLSHSTFDSEAAHGARSCDVCPEVATVRETFDAAVEQYARMFRVHPTVVLHAIEQALSAPKLPTPDSESAVESGPDPKTDSTAPH